MATWRVREDLADRDWVTALEGLPENARNIAKADTTAKMRRVAEGKFFPPIPFEPRGEVKAARVNRVSAHRWNIDAFYVERGDSLNLLLIDGYECADGLVEPPDASWDLAATRMQQYGL